MIPDYFILLLQGEKFVVSQKLYQVFDFVRSVSVVFLTGIVFSLKIVIDFREFLLPIRELLLVDTDDLVEVLVHVLCLDVIRVE